MQVQYLTSSELTSLDSPLVVGGVVVAMPFTHVDQAQKAASLMAARADAPGLVLAIYDTDQEGFISLINRAFAKTQSAYFAYVAQDAFAGRGWLKLALKALGNEKDLLGFNDGKWAGALAGFGLARRSWAAKNYSGAFFHPSYQRHYADAELTLLAMQRDVYAYDPNSLLVEADWTKDSAAVNDADRALFLVRKNTGFDGKVVASQLLNLIS
jgi:hypothetical protein